MSYIFKKTFEEIFSTQRINYELQKEGLNPIKSYDEFFDFTPHTSFKIPKHDNDYRVISIPSLKVKIIQKILYTNLKDSFKFSNRNYAYQSGKSPIKAINRIKNILPRFEFIIRCDIKNFFDEIDHDILYKKLKNTIKDEKILYLIMLFLKNGALFKGKWVDKFSGVYQGDVLSPFLANLYLDEFDKYFEQKCEFIRFADDMIFFEHSKKSSNKLLEDIKSFLSKQLKLTLNEDKTFITFKKVPFSYLGVVFNINENLFSIENDRLMKKISVISKETKKLNLIETIDRLNENVNGFHNYYKKVINNQNQFLLLQQRLEEIIIAKIIEAKQTKFITRKQDFFKYISALKTYKFKENFVGYIVNEAYIKLRLSNPKKAAEKKINSQKIKFSKNYLKTTELIITKTGSYLSFTKGKIKIKTYEENKLVPINVVKRIIITTTRSSISSYLIKVCAEHKIDIDFISDNAPYALLTYFKNIAKELHIAQLRLTFSPRGLEFAKNLHIAKAKNQINLLKYFNLRRANAKLDDIIFNMQKYTKKIKTAKDKKSLMGIEGYISTQYWNGFKIIIDNPSFVRTHKDSKDVINQTLNYAYAILYNKIQSALIKEGLNIYYPFLHSEMSNKPTLVFDFIEPFRQPIVDRQIISIITKKKKLTQSNNLLSEDTKKIIIQNIQERLGSFTKTRYGKTTYLNLISFEANSFKRDIQNNKIHKFFIAKY
jgi:CRISPR-associated endonuclease Cas1/group II intron reverse transcriptase/maturase